MRKLLLTLGLAAAFPAGATTVPLTLSGGEIGTGRIYVSVRFGNTMGAMRLDTGATSSRVMAAPWNQKFPVVGQSQSMSASGEMVLCDDVEARNVALEARGESNVGRAKYQLRRCPTGDGDALLGLDFFRGTRLVLDFKRSTMDVNPSGVFSQRASSPLIFLDPEHRLLGVPLQTGTLSVVGLLDSGAELSAVDTRFVEQHPELFEYVRDLENASDAGGNTWKPKLYRVKALRLGGDLDLKDALVMAYDFGNLREALGANTPFIFGYNLMSQFNWELDFRDSRQPTWIAEPR